MAKQKNSTPSTLTPPLDLMKVKEAIHSTGFNLEYQVSEHFRKANWSVINNKYYVDDTANSVREIDLIAYKVHKLGKLPVYTTLIVSCKKNEACVWALLSKKLRLNDPNTDWHPQHAWSNHPQLDYMFTKTDWVTKYIEACKKHSVYDTLISPERHVFAFQEIDKVTYKCRNDTNIFNSISSLMKAQGYEIGALNVRKREPAVYVFGLITVVDTELVRIDYGADGSTTAELINDDRYIGSYIINQKEITARIHFVTAQAFPSLISEYDKLFACNCKVVADLAEAFYQDLLSDGDRAEIVDPMFSRALQYPLNFIILSRTQGTYKSRDYKARRPRPAASVEVYGAKDIEEVKILNSSAEAKQAVTEALQKYYHYQGPWTFESEIPF